MAAAFAGYHPNFGGSIMTPDLDLWLHRAARSLSQGRTGAERN
jgi:hypothetical protein